MNYILVGALRRHERIKVKKRELYLGKKPYSYIAFNYNDAPIAEALLDNLELEGYRFWLNSKIQPTQEDFEEIGKRLGSSCATVLVLTENSMYDGIIAAVVESSIERRSPIVVYMAYETPEMITYLHDLMEKAVNVVVLRTWEQSFSSSNSVRQTLLQSKGITNAQAEELFEMSMDVLEDPDSTREEMVAAMKGISFAASNEYPPALNILGNISLENARKGSESYSTAALYHKFASDKGDINSIYTLGTMIADGEGFSKNPSAAAPYLAMAAVKGIPDAQYRIAEMMEYGVGMAQNRDNATVWYTKALESGDRRAFLKLADRYLVGDTVLRDEELAVKYYTESANDGVSEAYFMLAKLYRDGVGVNKSEEISEEYFLKAAESGVPEARYFHGSNLMKKKMYVEAFKWLTQAVTELPEGEEPCSDAYYLLAECYENGQGTVQDRAKAFLNYYRAAKHGHAKAKLAVAECYKKGIGVPVNKHASAFYDPGAIEG